MNEKMKMKFRGMAALFLCLGVLGPHPTALAQGAPKAVPYVGYLVYDAGGPVTGAFDVTVAVYAAETEGSLMWGPHTYTNVSVMDGVFTLLLGGGSSADLAPALDSGGALWLSFAIDGILLAPRQQIGAVPFARRAELAANSQSLGGVPAAAYALLGDLPQNLGEMGGDAGKVPVFTSPSSIGNSVISQHDGRVGVGVAAPNATLQVGGGVQLGMEAGACTSALAGTLQWNGTAVQVCTGTAWELLGAGGGSAPQFSYSPGTIVCVVGQPCNLPAPTNTGGTAASYSVSPSLPAGLALNASTGAISGTPIAVSSQSTYVVSAGNSFGTTNASVIITVNNIAPSNLSYTPTSLNCAIGVACSLAAPTYGGGTVVSFSINPSLPSGLSINSATGQISGTANAAYSSTSHTVTAVNSGGQTTASVTVSVSPSTRAFLTSQTFSSNLGGVSGGDQKCQAAAQAGGLSGSWRAFLTTSTTPAESRFAINYPLRQIGNNAILLSSAPPNLQSTPFEAPLNRTENGTVFNRKFWRGHVLLNANCNDWTSTSGTSASGLSHNDMWADHPNGHTGYAFNQSCTAANYSSMSLLCLDAPPP